MWKRMVVLAVALLLGTVIAVIKFGGDASVELTRELLKQQTALQGELTYEQMAPGISGEVEIKNLVWTGPDGRRLASVPRVTFAYDLVSSLLQGGGAPVINEIILDRPELFGNFDCKEGFSLANRINFVGVNETTGYKNTVLEPTSFRGLVEIKEGKINVGASGAPKDVTGKVPCLELTNVNGQAFFSAYPKIKANLTAKGENADLVLNMIKQGGETEFSGELKKASLTKLLPFFPGVQNIALKGGELPSVKFACNKIAENPWQISIKGKVTQLDGYLLDWGFHNGNGDFEAARDRVTFKNMKALTGGQPLTVEGCLYTNADKKEQPYFDAKIYSDAFALRALSAGIDTDGTVNFKAGLTGPATEPSLDGSFSGTNIVFPPLTLGSLSGNFIRDGGKLHFENVKADCYGGDIMLDGDVDMKTRNFAFHVAGKNLAAVRIGKQLGGRAEFTVSVTGMNMGDSAEADGNFTVENPEYENEKVSWLRGDILIRKGKFELGDVEMKKGWKNIDLQAELTAAHELRFVRKDSRLNVFGMGD